MAVTNTIYAMFRNAVRLYPHSTAISYKGASFTYQALGHRVNEVCNSILNVAGKDKIIGLTTRRGIEQIAGVLAILKSR